MWIKFCVGVFGGGSLVFFFWVCFMFCCCCLVLWSFLFVSFSSVLDFGFFCLHSNFAALRMWIAEIWKAVIQHHCTLLQGITAYQWWSTSCTMEQMCMPKIKGYISFHDTFCCSLLVWDLHPTYSFCFRFQWPLCFSLENFSFLLVLRCSCAVGRFVDRYSILCFLEKPLCSTYLAL